MEKMRGKERKELIQRETKKTSLEEGAFELGSKGE